MYAVEFTQIDGRVKIKYFKTFNGAKEHYDSFKHINHYWFNISMGKLKPEFIPKNYKIKEEWIN